LNFPKVISGQIKENLNQFDIKKIRLTFMQLGKVFYLQPSVKVDDVCDMIECFRNKLWRFNESAIEIITLKL